MIRNNDDNIAFLSERGNNSSMKLLLLAGIFTISAIGWDITKAINEVDNNLSSGGVTEY